MKIARAIEQADEGQADCYWHDNSVSLRYVIVLQGVTLQQLTGGATALMAQRAGQVTAPSKEFSYVAVHQPEMMPGETGPLSVLLVL